MSKFKVYVPFKYADGELYNDVYEIMAENCNGALQDFINNRDIYESYDIENHELSIINCNININNYDNKILKIIWVEEVKQWK